MKVMQCWDDGTETDVRLVELLRKYHAKATFNICPGLNQPTERKHWLRFRDTIDLNLMSIEEMKQLYQGFRVAGHSMTHPDLRNMPREKALAELVDCKQLIKEIFGFDSCGFAYPGGCFDAQVKEMVRQAGYLYARTIENIDTLLLPVADPMELRPHCHFQSPDFLAKYERVRAQDGVFYFWGHSFETFNDQRLWDDLESKLDMIHSDPTAQWIDVCDLSIAP